MSVVFQADDQPVASRPEYWQEVVGDVLCPLELRIPGPEHVPDRLVVGEAGPVAVAELTARRPGGATRTRTHVSRSHADLCKIDVFAGGRGVVAQDGRQASLTAGDFTFVDLARPCQWTNESARIVAVTFPRDLLPLRAERLTGVRIGGRQGLGALVSSLARRLPGNLDGGGSRLGSAVLDLLTAALAERLDQDMPPDTRRRALLLQVQAFIDAHLGDPELTPRSVAAAQYISVRYLHKLFEAEETTAAEWIRSRRLERCRRDLADPALKHEPVHAIAARWGLMSAAHFSRIFRAAYGAPPAEYRQSWPPSGGRTIVTPAAP
jgi:AraC-like DNA-binding protein